LAALALAERAHPGIGARHVGAVPGRAHRERLPCRRHDRLPRIDREERRVWHNPAPQSAEQQFRAKRRSAPSLGLCSAMARDRRTGVSWAMTSTTRSAMKHSVEAPDWSAIPAPADDGATRHLMGTRMASVPLQATNGEMVDLSSLPGRVVVYAYPRTGRPGIDNPTGWDMIPGARGCTPQSCAFRDHFAELKALGVDRLFGLSTQDHAYQREAVERMHLPFAMLSDE